MTKSSIPFFPPPKNSPFLIKKTPENALCGRFNSLRTYTHTPPQPPSFPPHTQNPNPAPPPLSAPPQSKPENIYAPPLYIQPPPGRLPHHPSLSHGGGRREKLGSTLEPFSEIEKTYFQTAIEWEVSPSQGDYEKREKERIEGWGEDVGMEIDRLGGRFGSVRLW